MDRSEEHTSELQAHHDLVCCGGIERKKKGRRLILLGGWVNDEWVEEMNGMVEETN